MQSNKFLRDFEKLIVSVVRTLVTYWLYFLFTFDRASFERFRKNMGDFCFQNFCCLSLLSIILFSVYFFSKYIFVRVLVILIDTKEMGNRDAIKICVNVEIKFWLMQKKLLLDHTGSEMKHFVFNFRQWLIVIRKPGLLF